MKPLSQAQEGPSSRQAKLGMEDRAGCGNGTGGAMRQGLNRCLAPNERESMVGQVPHLSWERLSFGQVPRFQWKSLEGCLRTSEERSCLLLGLAHNVQGRALGPARPVHCGLLMSWSTVSVLPHSLLRFHNCPSYGHHDYVAL